MSDIIKMDYDKMSEMAQAFGQASDTLQEMKSEVSSIADEIANGALLGQGGEAFENACRGTLMPVIDKLDAKMLELMKDVMAAVSHMQDAEGQNASSYNN